WRVILQAGASRWGRAAEGGRPGRQRAPPEGGRGARRGTAEEDPGGGPLAAILSGGPRAAVRARPAPGREQRPLANLRRRRGAGGGKVVGTGHETSPKRAPTAASSPTVVTLNGAALGLRFVGPRRAGWPRIDG